MAGRLRGTRAFQTPWFCVHEHVPLLTSRQLFLKLHSTCPNGQGSDDLYTAYNTLLTAALSTWSSHKRLTPATFVAFVQSVLSGLPSTSSSAPEFSSLTWLGGSLVDMLWSIDIELDELVAESKASESTSGGEHQKDGEKDKQVVADLVRKLLVCQPFQCFVPCTEPFSPRRLESFNLVLAESVLIVASFMPPVLVSTNRTGTSAKFERGRVYCWYHPTQCLPNCDDIFSSATSKTKLISCGNKPKDTANLLQKSRAALVHRTLPLQACRSNLLRSFATEHHPFGVESSVSLATLTSIQTVRLTSSWTSLQLIWRPTALSSWLCSLYHPGLLLYLLKNYSQAQVALISTMFSQTRKFYQTVLHRI